MKDLDPGTVLMLKVFGYGAPIALIAVIVFGSGWVF